jgi:allantoinase
VVGCETLGPLMVDAMVRGRLSATRLAAVLSSSTARLYGLYPRKGAILPGSDADFTIVDPTATRTIRNENLVAKQPISPWHGTELRGLPCAAVLRGVVVMQDGEPIGDRRGHYVGADHTVSPAELFRR